MITRFMFTTACLACSLSIFAQETVITSGGDVSSTSGSVSYSMGQLVIQAYGTESNLIIEGVQQPFEISDHTSLPEIVPNNFDIACFPNPVRDQLTVQVDPELLPAQYRLYDNSGRLIEQQPIRVFEQHLSASHLAVGSYILEITDGKRSLKRFQLIKN